MKLINADILKQDIGVDEPKISMWSSKLLGRLIDDEKAVDAVPISFIEKYFADGVPMDEPKTENEANAFYLFALVCNWLNEPEKDKWCKARMDEDE